MPNLAHLTIAGYLGRDPEMQYTPEGRAQTSFSVAVQPGKEAETMWFSVKTYGSLAESCNQYLRKGSAVLCQGNLKAKAYTKANGLPGVYLDMNAQAVHFLDKGQPVDNGSEDTMTPLPLGDIPF